MNIKYFKVYLFLFMVFAFGSCSVPEISITQLDDLHNVSIGVMTGSTGEVLTKKRWPNATVKSFDDIMDAIAALKANQLDAVVTGYPTALNVCKRNHDIRTLPEPVDFENTSIAVKKGRPELVAELNAFIDELLNDGTLEDMKRRWFKPDLLPYEEKNITQHTTGEVLKIGTNATREPFCFVDANQKMTGHDGEFALRIGERLKRPIEFVDMKFSALIPALQSGKIDLIVTGMTATDERRKSVDFTRSYFENSQVAMIKASAREGIRVNDSEPKLKALGDVADKTIGVYAGTVHDAFVEENYPGADVKRFNFPADLILSLKMSKVDAVFMDLVSAKVMLKSNPEIGILTDDVLTLPVGIAFNKNNPELLNNFNTFLKEIKADGKYDTIYKRWFIDDPEEAKMPEFNLNKNAPEITLAVAVGDLPNSAIVNGEHVGFDIEMLKTFAVRKGFNLNIITMEFSALIAALSSGKADMIADGICITEERKKHVAFSDEYNEFKTAVLALNANLVTGQAAPLPDNKSFFQKVSESFYNNIIHENRYLLILDGLKVTVIISILATIFGTLLGGLICFMRMSRNMLLLLTAKIYISILRGTPVLVVLMIIFYIVFASVDIDPMLVAVVAFGLNFAAYVSEMFRTGIEGIDRGQTEAGIALGFTKVKTFIYIVLPQALRRILPVYKGEIISLVKMTSIVGYIAVQDLTKASDIIRSRTFDAFFPLIMVAVLYFCISWLLMYSLGCLERKTSAHHSTRRA